MVRAPLFEHVVAQAPTFRADSIHKVVGENGLGKMVSALQSPGGVRPPCDE